MYDMNHKGFVDDIAQALANNTNLEPGVAKYEARTIVSHVVGIDFPEVQTAEILLAPRQKQKIESIIEERSLGKPLAYVLNSAPFRNLDLYVDERVLIPRSETELLVEKCLEVISPIAFPRVLEIGTGSGAIAYSIVDENKSATVVSADISEDALEVARLNGAAVGTASSRVSFLQSDVYSALSIESATKFDVIISNPPYIGEDEADELDFSVKDFEPKNALFADRDGFDITNKVIEGARNFLNASGHVLLETSPRHIDSIESAAVDNNFKNCEIVKDFAGRARIAILS